MSQVSMKISMLCAAYYHNGGLCRYVGTWLSKYMYINKNIAIDKYLVGIKSKAITIVNNIKLFIKEEVYL